MNPLVDSHAHIVSDDAARFPPRPEAETIANAILDGPMTSERLQADMAAAGVDKALLVQRTQIYGYDNSYVVAAAEDAPGRLFPVCAIDARRPGGANEIAAWRARGAVGFRIMAKMGEAELRWLTGDTAEEVWRACADIGAPLCVHVFPWNRKAGLEALLALLGRFADLPVVVDHLTNAKIEGGASNGVDDLVRRLAEHPNVVFKFTTIPLGRLKRDGVDARPVLEAFVALAGAERLMWGSDVAQSPGGYAAMTELAAAAVAEFDPRTQSELLGGVAARVYGL